MFRPRELHITFAMLKVIGRYIGYIGIYRLYIEVGLYGHTTIGQIIYDKHQKVHRSIYDNVFGFVFKFFT